MTGLPEAWLAGELRCLPWAQDRWEDLQWWSWWSLRDLVVELAQMRGRRPKDLDPQVLLVIKRALQLTDTLEGTLRTHLPRHLWAVAPPGTVTELLATLADLRAVLGHLPKAWRDLPRVRRRLAGVDRIWPIRPNDQPSLAQVVEYRLIGQAWAAWLADAKRRFPLFDPQREWPEPFIEGEGFDVRIRYPAPLDEWFKIEARLRQLLCLNDVRRKMFGTIPSIGARDQDEGVRATPVLGRALAWVLGPWLEGEVSQVPSWLLKEPWSI